MEPEMETDPQERAMRIARPAHRRVSATRRTNAEGRVGVRPGRRAMTARAVTNVPGAMIAPTAQAVQAAQISGISGIGRIGTTGRTDPAGRIEKAGAARLTSALAANLPVRARANPRGS